MESQHLCVQCNSVASLRCPTCSDRYYCVRLCMLKDLTHKKECSEKHRTTTQQKDEELEKNRRLEVANQVTNGSIPTVTDLETFGKILTSNTLLLNTISTFASLTPKHCLLICYVPYSAFIAAHRGELTRDTDVVCEMIIVGPQDARYNIAMCSLAHISSNMLLPPRMRTIKGCMMMQLDARTLARVRGKGIIDVISLVGDYGIIPTTPNPVIIRELLRELVHLKALPLTTESISKQTITLALQTCCKYTVSCDNPTTTPLPAIPKSSDEIVERIPLYLACYNVGIAVETVMVLGRNVKLSGMDLRTIMVYVVFTTIGDDIECRIQTVSGKPMTLSQVTVTYYARCKFDAVLHPNLCILPFIFMSIAIEEGYKLTNEQQIKLARGKASMVFRISKPDQRTIVDM